MASRDAADRAYAQLRDTVTQRGAGVAATPSAGAVVPAAAPAAGSSGSAEPNLWQKYLKQLVEHPVRTKALTSGVCSAIATILAQRSMGVPLSSLNVTSIRNQGPFCWR
jgi:hypothetical protein